MTRRRRRSAGDFLANVAATIWAAAMGLLGGGK